MKTRIKFRAPRNRRERRVLIFLLAKLGFSGLTNEDAVKKARQVVQAMTGNANFTTPNPTLVSISDAADALYAAEQALDGTKIKTNQRNLARKALNKLMSGILTYVDNIANGDTEVVLSAGMDLRNPKTKAVVLPAPVGLQISMTTGEGELKLTFQPVKKKLFYLVEAAADFPGPQVWESVAESSKATVIITGLQPGQKYQVRVRTVNSAGISNPSEVVVCRTLQY
jgi:hypothetical protein